MDTVIYHTPEWQNMLLNTLPLLFIVVKIIFVVFVIRYFLRLGKDVQEIRKLLEKKQ